MNYKKQKIRIYQASRKEYFLDCIDELYTVVEEQSLGYEVKRVVNNNSRLKSWIVRKLAASPIFYNLRLKLSTSNNINFAAMISGDFQLMAPAVFFSRRNYIYMYDVWPRFHKWIFPLLDFFNITYIFFSSKQVYELYQQHANGNKCKAMWLPEAITVDEYFYKPAEERSIDVLEFGRNYAAYHDLIAGKLALKNKKHVFKTPEQQVLFPGKVEFTAALADSKIVICIPSDISHPERAEYISTMTLRYLQAIASKCLIVGIMPSDMEEIFGYMPIVEIDMEHAAEQIIDVLDNYQNYLPLIEKNYETVKTKHQWQNRWGIIKQRMEVGNE